MSYTTSSAKLMFSLANIHDVQKKFVWPLCRTEGAKSHRSESFEVVLLCWIFFLIYLKLNNPSILCSCISLKPTKQDTAQCIPSCGPAPRRDRTEEAEVAKPI